MSDLFEMLVVALMVVAVLASLAGAVLPFVFWRMHVAMERRMAKVESQLDSLPQALMTHADALRMAERLSGLESKFETVMTILGSIQRHLLEKEK